MLNSETTPKVRVLYVDDEEKALKYFRMAFSEAFEILTASSAEEGIATLRGAGGTIAIVISDQRMPGTAGADFLGQVRAEFPAAIRILTTAYSDLDSAIRAVNRGHIYQYVTKPWDIPELQGVLRRAADYHHVITERDQLLALKMSTLQRILCSDRLKWLLIYSRSLSERKQAAFRRALSAFVAALPLPLKPLVSEGAGFRKRDFEIGVLIQEEYHNAARCLDLLNAWTVATGAKALPPELVAPIEELAARDVGELWSVPESLRNFLSVLIASSGLEPGDVALQVGEGALKVSLRPSAAAFSADEFLRVLFGLLIERETCELSVLFFELLLALSVADTSLQIEIAGAGSPAAIAFAPGGEPDGLEAIVEKLYSKFSEADINAR